MECAACLLCFLSCSATHAKNVGGVTAASIKSHNDLPLPARQGSTTCPPLRTPLLPLQPSSSSAWPGSRFLQPRSEIGRSLRPRCPSQTRGRCTSVDPSRLAEILWWRLPTCTGGGGDQQWRLALGISNSGTTHALTAAAPSSITYTRQILNFHLGPQNVSKLNPLTLTK